MDAPGRYYAMLDGQCFGQLDTPSREIPMNQDTYDHYLTSSEELQDTYSDAAVKAKYGKNGRHHHHHHRNKWTPTQRDQGSRCFQKELEKAHRALHEKRRSPKEDHEKGTEVGKKKERLICTPLLSPDSAEHENKNDSRKDNRQLTRQLQKTQRLLACETSQKKALKERLEQVESRVKQAENSQTDELRLERYSQRTRNLQEEVKGYRTELEEEKLKGQRLQQEMDAIKKENRKYQEKMRLLMFHYIPSVSPKFKDVGSVNYDLEESDELVGHYQLGKMLGEGHYGKVQVGTDQTTKQSYAIKLLNKDRITKICNLKQIAMEVHVLKKYPHPNMVHLQDVIHATENIYLITELCLMDLHKYHNDFGLTENAAKQVILGVLRPLQHLHSHGICHLDLKPENILLTRSVDLQNVTHEHVRLCDFGLVNMARKPDCSKEIVRKGYACGTPGFFAPEMILNNEFEGRMADMWSLGCIVLEVTLGFTQEWIASYECINSEPTKFQEGLESCLNEIAPERYPLHRTLLDILHRCLTIDSTKRISSVDALTHPWLADIAVLDENRQDSGQPRHNLVADTTNLYAERSDLMASAFLC